MLTELSRHLEIFRNLPSCGAVPQSISPCLCSEV